MPHKYTFSSNPIFWSYLPLEMRVQGMNQKEKSTQCKQY